MVGAARFELATPSPPDWCANRAALRSEDGKAAGEAEFAPVPSLMQMGTSSLDGGILSAATLALGRSPA